MTDGNTHAINQRLNDREDWDALQEVTAELQQAEARIEELEVELEEQVEWLKGLADDLIAAEGREARLKEKLGRALEFIQDLTGCEWPFDESAKRTLAELKGEKHE